MSIYSIHNKKRKELINIYKENSYKYPANKSKQGLINGLIIRLAFKGFKKAYINRLEDEISKLHNERNLVELFGQIPNDNSIDIDEEEYNEYDECDECDECGEAEVDVIKSELDLFSPQLDNLKREHPNDTFNVVLHDDKYKNNLYKVHKDNIMEKYGSLGPHDEEYLYHGTDEKNIRSILDNDFSLNNTGTHATVYGKGIYFTNRLKYACRYSTDNPHKKFIVISKVHVGDIVAGYNTLIRLPNMDSGKTYDTAVNTTDNPYIFVKFKNEHYTIVGYIEITLGENSNLHVVRGGSRSFGSLVTQPYTISSSRPSTNSSLYLSSYGSNVPKYNNGDKVVYDKRVYTIVNYTKIGDQHIYTIKSVDSNVKLSVVEHNIYSWIDPNGSRFKASISITNLTKKSISIYFVPKDKCIYKHLLKEFKLMNTIDPGESKKYTTNIDDGFICTNRNCIIKYFKVSVDKEQIKVQL
jgi:hypothetical protein